MYPSSEHATPQFNSSQKEADLNSEYSDLTQYSRNPLDIFIMGKSALFLLKR